MNKETGGAAFPLIAETLSDITETGMTLRDYFAAKAIIPLISFSNDKNYENEAAKAAYRYADAMLEARK